MLHVYEQYLPLKVLWCHILKPIVFVLCHTNNTHQSHFLYVYWKKHKSCLAHRQAFSLWTVTGTSQCTSSESKSFLSKFTPTCFYSFLPPFFIIHHSKKQGFTTLSASPLGSVLGTGIILHCKQLISISIVMESRKTILDYRKVGFCWSANLAEMMRVTRGLMILELVSISALKSRNNCNYRANRKQKLEG